MSRSKCTLLLVLAVALLTGCGGSSDSAGESVAEATIAATPDALAGRTFISTSMTGRDLAPDSQISLEFTADTLGFRAGCNSNLGKYQVRKGNLKFFPGPSTLMACPDELMAQDDWLRTFLEEGVDASLGEDQLRLSGNDDVVIELEESVGLPGS